MLLIETCFLLTLTEKTRNLSQFQFCFIIAITIKTFSIISKNDVANHEVTLWQKKIENNQ